MKYHLSAYPIQLLGLVVGALAAGESCPEEAQAQGAIALANMTLVSHSLC